MFALAAAVVWLVDLILYWTKADVSRVFDVWSLLLVGLILAGLHLAGVGGWRRAAP